VYIYNIYTYMYIHIYTHTHTYIYKYVHIYTARSQRRQTWAPPEEDAVGMAAKSVVESGNLTSVESGNFTAGKNVAW
jgi:hypothetical protein